jgi:hypothetical protein
VGVGVWVFWGSLVGVWVVVCGRGEGDMRCICTAASLGHSHAVEGADPCFFDFGCGGVFFVVGGRRGG